MMNNDCQHCILRRPRRRQRSMTSSLIDTFGRSHNNLRISVTDRCNLRCTYCMPEDVVFMDRSALLTFEEIARFVRVAAPLGIDKVRLTGGEPLMRRGLTTLVRQLCAIDGIRDALDPDRFRQLARRDGLDRVLAGIRAAKQAGFDPVKVNAVSIRGVTEH